MNTDNESDFKRQSSNPGAIINVNNEALESYKKAKARYNKINKIDELEARLARIEELLLKVLDK